MAREAIHWYGMLAMGSHGELGLRKQLCAIGMLERRIQAYQMECAQVQAQTVSLDAHGLRPSCKKKPRGQVVVGNGLAAK